MASLDDLLTAQKNGVVALSAIQQALTAVVPAYTSATVTASTLIVAGRGKLLHVSVLVAGSTTGFVYNASTVGSAAAANALVPVINTIGIYSAGVVFTNGLVVTPGTGQSINITYMIG